MSQEPASRPGSRPASQPSAQTRSLQVPGERPKQKRDGGFFGLRFVEIKREGKSALYLTGVFKGSDAERLGFRKGDTLLGIDGERFENADRFLMGFYMKTARLNQRTRSFSPTKKKHFMNVSRAGKDHRIAFSILELDKNPKAGSQAPDLTLEKPDAKTKVKLSSLWKDKPLFLVFGSFT